MVFALGATLAAQPPPQHGAVTFTRTDSAVTQVTVRQGGEPGTPVSPRIFSNFLEHLGGSIYEALWANVVYNPQFEAERDGHLARWSLDRGTWLDEGVRGRSVRLPEGAAVRQSIHLPVHRQLRYRGTVWVRSMSSKHPVLEIVLRNEGGATIASTKVRTGGSRWLPRRFDLRISEGAVARAERLELTLASASGEVDVDMLEVFPADAVSGVDPEVLQIARSLRIELLRWPGGNFVSGYHWHSAIGPRERRPTVPNPAWGGLETHHFGTDEFMEFCRRIGAKPHICLNAGNGAPEEAAAWVEYCNGAATTRMGALRAANGHPEPYDVRVWEIGNELYGEWQIGHTDAAGNARRFVEFRKAMTAIDPTIEIIATGKGDQFAGRGLAVDQRWNAAVLDAARSDGRSPDHLSLHPLVPLPSGLGAAHSYEEIYLSAMAHPLWWSEVFAPGLRRLLTEHGGRPVPKIAVTEWGIIVGGPDWREYASHDSQSGAVYAGLFYNAMMRAADMVDIGEVTALMHGGCIRKRRGVVYVMPMIHVQRMYGQARPGRLMPIEVTGPAYDVPRRGLLPEMRDVPWLDVLAAENRGRVILFVVNRDPNGPREADIAFPRIVVDASVETLAADPRATNDDDDPDRVAPSSRTVEGSGKAVRLSLPPSSVTIASVRFRR